MVDLLKTYEKIFTKINEDTCIIGKEKFDQSDFKFLFIRDKRNKRYRMVIDDIYGIYLLEINYTYFKKDGRYPICEIIFYDQETEDFLVQGKREVDYEIRLMIEKMEEYSRNDNDIRFELLLNGRY